MSRSILDPRLCFVCEYVDDMANLVREFQLLYFYDDNSVELTELKTKKIYLRRITCPGLSKEQFYLGGTVMIYGRVIRLTRFGDEVTRQLCEESAEYTSIVLSEALLPRLGSVLAVLTEECGFGIKAMQSILLSLEAAAKAGIDASFAGKRAVVIQAVRRQAVQRGHEFASRIGKNVVVAQHQQQADAWQFLFNEPSSALQGDYNTSVVIVKPHALQRVIGGEIIQLLINEGLAVSAICLRAQSAHQADFLLQPYKGVLVDYSATVQSVSGNLWVVQFTARAGSQDVDVVGRLRDACGPFDPTVAKALAPGTIRGRFGVDRVFNAVHCTDVAADAIVYAGFLFRPSA